MAFKGVLPSDLWDRYDRDDGYDRLMLDISIANEINDLVAEAHADAKGKAGADTARGAVARRNQRRRERQTYLSNTDDFFDSVEKAGVPVREVGGVDD